MNKANKTKPKPKPKSKSKSKSLLKYKQLKPKQTKLKSETKPKPKTFDEILLECFKNRKIPKDTPPEIRKRIKRIMKNHFKRN